MLHVGSVDLSFKHQNMLGGYVDCCGNFHFSSVWYSANKLKLDLKIIIIYLHKHCVSYTAVGEDYLPMNSVTFSFSMNSPLQTVCKQVTLIDDNIVEDEETFQVTLDSVTPGVVIDSPDVQTIYIFDNDSMYTTLHM